MADARQTGSVPDKRGVSLGAVSLASALIAALAVTGIGLLSFTGESSYEPPGWIRIVTVLLLPVGVSASVLFGVAALVKRSGPRWAVAGLIVAALSVVAMFVMLSIAG